MSDTKTALSILEGHLNTPLASGAKAEAEKQYTDIFRIRKDAADAMAADATAESLGFAFPYAGIVTKIGVVTDADVLEDAADNATVTVRKRDAGGINPVALGTYTTDTGVAGQGSLLEFVEKDFDLSNVAGALDVVEGGSCTFEITKGGAGIVVPIAEIAVYVLRQ